MKSFNNYATNKIGNKTNKSYICLTLLAILTLLTAGIPVMAAENSTGTINITVQVSAKTIVVIDPDILTWIGGESVNPGEEGLGFVEGSLNVADALQITISDLGSGIG